MEDERDGEEMSESDTKNAVPSMEQLQLQKEIDEFKAKRAGKECGGCREKHCEATVEDNFERHVKDIAGSNKPAIGDSDSWEEYARRHYEFPSKDQLIHFGKMIDAYKSMAEVYKEKLEEADMECDFITCHACSMRADKIIDKLRARRDAWRDACGQRNLVSFKIYHRFAIDCLMTKNPSHLALCSFASQLAVSITTPEEHGEALAILDRLHASTAEYGTVRPLIYAIEQYENLECDMECDNGK